MWNHATRIGEAANGWLSRESNRRHHFRRGFAVKELLVVLAVTGGGGACLMLLDPLSDEQRAARASEHEPLMQYNVPIAGEFVGLVSVEAYVSRDPSVPPYYVSRLRFAPQAAETSGAFLFDIVCSEHEARHISIKCRTWSFTSVEAALAAHQEDDVITDSHVSERSPVDVLAQMLTTPYCLQEVRRLPDPFWRCVPPGLEETGLLMVDSETSLRQLHEPSAFPLGRLAAAIRTAARDENWCRDDPRSLLPGDASLDLPPDRQQALAEALIWRLERDLPAG